MNKTNTGGPAFPAQWFDEPTDDIAFAQGMTLRDYFAAKAMQGMMTDPNILGCDKIAEWAYQQADAMLKEREA